MIMRMRKLSEGGLKVLVQGSAARACSRSSRESPFMRCGIERWTTRRPADRTPAGSRRCCARCAAERRQAVELGKSMQPELAMMVQSVEEPGRMADLIASNLTLKVPRRRRCWRPIPRWSGCGA
jgi:ATP-dependent Lon protease